MTSHSQQQRSVPWSKEVNEQLQEYDNHDEKNYNINEYYKVNAMDYDDDNNNIKDFNIKQKQQQQQKQQCESTFIDVNDLFIVNWNKNYSNDNNIIQSNNNNSNTKYKNEDTFISNSYMCEMSKLW